MKMHNMFSFNKRKAMIAVTLIIGAALYFSGCKGSPTSADENQQNESGTPRTAVPADLVGTWYHGSISSINFYNPSTGSWNNGYGEGLFYSFTADGHFEYGWQVYANSYGCSSRALVYRKGTVTVDPATSTIKVYTTFGRIHSEDNCVASSNYDRAIPLENETLIWEFGKDEYNNTVLWLRYPETGPSGFYRQ